MMKFCEKCGNEVMDEAVVCTKCGCSLVKKVQPIEQSDPNDKPNFGLLVLSVLIPLVGIILWPCLHKKKPKAAQAYGITGIVAWVVTAILLLMINS